MDDPWLQVKFASESFGNITNDIIVYPFDLEIIKNRSADYIQQSYNYLTSLKTPPLGAIHHQLTV